MFEGFQQCPTLIVVIFLVIWVIGWSFYFFRRWRHAKSKGPSNMVRQEIIAKLIGGIVGVSIIYWKIEWIRYTLLAGLSGLHRGTIGALIIVIVFFGCSQITYLFWKLLVMHFRRKWR